MPVGMSFVASSVSPALRPATTRGFATKTPSGERSPDYSKPFVNGSIVTWPDTPLPAGGKRKFTIQMRATSGAPLGQIVTVQSTVYQTAVSDVSYWCVH